MFRKMRQFILIAGLFLFCLDMPALADNNKVGIHILETTEAEQAAGLVNSNGGDWGYATIVLRLDDLDKNKWQKFMDDCRKLHLIPLVRLATKMENNFWAKPKKEDFALWADFLNSLNWPTKNQWVILFNEPNHAHEWGGEIDPAEYAEITDELIRIFRVKNANFRLMLAGFDQAADGRNQTMTIEEFISAMVCSAPEVFKKIDAWCSHSYPNHGFLGRPADSGKASIKGYQWELSLISRLVNDEKIKDYDVYITETGWPSGKGYYNEETASDYLIQAFNYWEQDQQVKAVTPFVLNYPEPPFAGFSWFNKEGRPNQNFAKVLGISKTAGTPEQIKSYEITAWELSDVLPVNYEIKGKIKIKNTGQWIMGEDVLEFQIQSLELGECGIIQSPKLIPEGILLEPKQEGELEFKLKTGTQSGKCVLKLADQEYQLYTFKPFELKNEHVSLWQQIKTKIKLEWRKR